MLLRAADSPEVFGFTAIVHWHDTFSNEHRTSQYQIMAVNETDARNQARLRWKEDPAVSGRGQFVCTHLSRS